MANEKSIKVTARMLEAGYPHLMDFHWGEDEADQTLVRIYQSMREAQIAESAAEPRRVDVER